MGWINLVMFIILAVLGLWGLISREKWLEDESKKNKKS